MTQIDMGVTPASVAIATADAAVHGRRRLGKQVSTSLGSPWGKAFVYALAVLWTVPTFGILVSSFRPETAVKTSGWWKWFANPDLTLKSYESVLSSGDGGDNLWHFFINSLEITLPSVFLSVGIALLAAYAFSWMNFPGRDWLFVGVVALLMVPLQMALIPMLDFMVNGEIFNKKIPLLGSGIDKLDLTQGVYGVWFAHVCFGMPFCIFIMKNFVSALPKDIIEAARVDGASHFTTFWRLIVPLSVPAIASLTIFQFMWIWNDLLVALIFTNRENAPITKELKDLVGTRGNAWHILTAAGMVSMILPIVVFFSLQRYFVRGLLAGAVKG
jgi:alpha-glucoside transport system permease protein